MRGYHYSIIGLTKHSAIVWLLVGGLGLLAALLLWAHGHVVP